MSNAVLSEVVGDVLVVTINRPAARNAINQEASFAIAEAIDQLDSRDELRAAVLTGAGGTFCSGMDLKAYLAGESMNVNGRGLGGICVQPPRKPLVAAVEGWALAGGFELMLACDLVVAAEGARFGIPEVKRGLAAAAGGLLRLPRRIPLAIAMELALTGDPIDSTRAYTFGLVNRVVPNGSALASALELATRISHNGPLAVAASKLVLDKALEWTVLEGFTKQQAHLGPLFTSEDATEGARAFAEKREPVWKGR